MQSQELLQEERERNEQMRTSWRKLLYKCKILQNQLQECNINHLMHTKGDVVVDSSPLDPLDIVGTADNQIDILVAEVLLMPCSLLFLCSVKIQIFYPDVSLN